MRIWHIGAPCGANIDAVHLQIFKSRTFIRCSDGAKHLILPDATDCLREVDVASVSESEANKEVF